MADKQAKISLGVEGADAARRAATDLETAWTRSARSIGTAWSGMGRAIGSQISQTVSDVSRIALAVDAIDFAGAIKGSIDLQASLERMAVGAGRGAGDLKSKFTAIGDKIGEQPNKVAAWSRALNRTVFDFDKTAAAAAMLGEVALETGQTLEEMLDLSSVTARSSKDVEALGRSVGNLRAQAALLGKEKGAGLMATVGGASAGLVDKFAPGAIKGKGGLTGAVGAISSQLIEKGFSPDKAAETANRLLTDITSDPRGMERLLGQKRGSLTDDYGRITADPLELLKRQQKAVGGLSHGSKEYAKYMAQATLGPVAGGAAVNLDFDAAGRLANLEGTPTGPGILARGLMPTVNAEAEIIENQRKAADAAASVVNPARSFAAEHPFIARAGAYGAASLGNLDFGDILTGGVGLKAVSMARAASAAAGAAGAAGGTAAATGSAAAATETALAVTSLAEAAGTGTWGAGGLLAGGGVAAGLGIGGVVGAGAVGAGAVLMDIGQDTVSTGADWRNAHPELMAQSQVDAVLRAGEASGGDPLAFLSSLPPNVRADIANNPSLQNIAGAAVNNTPLDANTLGAEFRRALEHADIKITVYNATEDPSIAVTSDKANVKVPN